MHRLRTFCFAACTFALLSSSAVQAALLMTVNSTSKTLSFGNSTDTGTPFGPTGALATWRTDALFAGTANENLLISSALMVDGSPAGNAELQLNAMALGQYAEISVFEGTAYTTVTGNGTSVSYAGLDADLQVGLEFIANNTLPFELNFGAGFTSIDTQLIPEPSTYAFATALGALGLIAIRRRR